MYTNRAQKNFEEESIPLTTDATIKENLERQLKSELVHFVVMGNGSYSNQINHFFSAFTDSPVSFEQKFTYIDEVVALKKYSRRRMGTLIAYLLKECSTFEEFTTYILPHYINHYDGFDRFSMEVFIKNLIEFLKKLKPNAFFTVLTLPGVQGTPLYQSFLATPYSWNCHTPILKTIRLEIPQCIPDLLGCARSIVDDFLDNVVLKKRHFVKTYEEILWSLDELLKKIPEPEDLFTILKKCPKPMLTSSMAPYINVVVRAYDKGMPKDEVVLLLAPFFKSDNKLFKMLPSKIQGLLLYDLIVRELVSEHYQLSRHQKVYLFRYIIDELPMEQRRNTLLNISNHEDIPLNQYLWPQSNRCSFFASGLPGKWVKEMKPLLAEDDEPDNGLKI